MKQHFYLFAGNVTFMAAPDAANVVTLSTVLPFEQKEVTVREMARAQQGLQIALNTKIQQDAPVIDVVITSVSYLGEMTIEEFTCDAEGPTVVMDTEEPEGDRQNETVQ